MTDAPPSSPRARRPKTGVGSLFHSLVTSEASGGLVLIGAAALALIIANSGAAATYEEALHLRLGPLTTHEWINDLLMAVFFLLVGLEIKREFVEGELSQPRQRVLPGVAALGGMIAPALIYLILNRSSGAANGWAVPVATDIAFALGVLGLLGSRVPPSLRVFLTALAIIDDLLAVGIIALFYTDHLAAGWLLAAAATLGALALLRRFNVQSLAPYLLLGVPLWAFTFLSGVHATVAGVALALTIPSGGGGDEEEPPLHRLEHAIQPFVAFLVIPLFGFANAGVALGGYGLGILFEPIALGVAAGLFFGKQIGVFLSTLIAVRWRWGEAPEGASLLHIYGVSLLCGIGFTMSLFIGMLAFDDAVLRAEVKVGVLAGSLLSAVAGAVVLRMARHQGGVSTVSTASADMSG